MPATRYGIDLAGAFSAAENIKGARTKNAMSEIALSEEQRRIRLRPEKERAALEREKTLQGLRSGAAGGDTNAAQKLLSIDPEGGAKFMDAVGKMDAAQIEKSKAAVEEMGKMSSWVLEGRDPKEQARRYALMRNGMNPEAAAALPEEFDSNFMSMSLVRAQSMDEILANPEVITMGTENIMLKGGQEIGRADDPQGIKVVTSGTEDVTYQGDQEIDRTKTAIKPPSGSGSGNKSADEALMYRMAGGLLGGTFDQNGNIVGLDPDARNNVQAITTEATKIYSAGGVTRAQAVKQAANKFGVDVRRPPKPNADDPANIQNFINNQ